MVAPAIIMAIGAALGAGAGFMNFGEQEKQTAAARKDKQRLREIEAKREKWSPWSGQHGQSIADEKDPSMWANLLQGAGAGLGMGQQFVGSGQGAAAGANGGSTVVEKSGGDVTVEAPETPMAPPSMGGGGAEAPIMQPQQPAPMAPQSMQSNNPYAQGRGGDPADPNNPYGDVWMQTERKRQQQMRGGY